MKVIAAAFPPASALPSRLAVDADLLRKYGGQGPRYTSYPTADRFVEAFDAAAYARRLANRTIGGIRRPLSLYVHLPFCQSVCYYCACTKVVTRDRSKATRYVGYLGKEIAMVASQLEDDRAVAQMHWGGGTPTYLADDEIAALWDTIAGTFDLDPRGEYAIEVDPRRVGPERIALLGRLGFNRISVGVQDFDPEVQAAVHRIQSVAETRSVIEAARAHGFRSVNMDLIYGLPKQTAAGFSRTLDQVLECRPDRVALYSYAHLPSLFKPQRRIFEMQLPAGEVKLKLLTLTIEKLTAEGYEYIGMDHFARRDDELAVAQREGRLTRNFQGYSADGDCDIVGFGMSAIGTIGPAYAQNAKELEQYYALLDAGGLPVLRGLELSADDLLRRAIIQSLACHFAVSKEAMSIAHLIDFDSYFALELEQLNALEEDGLVCLDEEWITVTPPGRLLVRAVCAVFDRFLREARTRAAYSRVL
jgi:oxygen-independent coproporphyrinogen III oxidase